MGRTTFYPPNTVLVVGTGGKAFISTPATGQDGITSRFSDRTDIHNIEDGAAAPEDLLPGTLGVKCVNHSLAVRNGDEYHPLLFIVGGDHLWKSTDADGIFRRIIKERTLFKTSYNLFVSILDLDTPVEPLPSSHILFEVTDAVIFFLRDLSTSFALEGIFFNPFMQCSTSTYTWALYSLEMNKTDFVFVTSEAFLTFLVTGRLLLGHSNPSLEVISAIPKDLIKTYGISVEKTDEGTTIEFPKEHKWLKSSFVNPYTIQQRGQ